jgi:hypothetical protein
MKKRALLVLRSVVVLVSAMTMGGETSAAASKLPRGIIITSQSKTHVHANISDVRVENYSALTNIHALYTVYFHGDAATDEKLKALARLRFTNLTCVGFTDCALVTDKGIAYLSEIPTLERLGLRHMSITDATCETMATKMRLLDVNMPNCSHVTLNGLLKMIHSESLESLGFSVGNLTQNDLIQLISTAAPQLGRMDIDMDTTAEGRLDFPALRKAAKAKKIRLFAVRNKHVSAL